VGADGEGLWAYETGSKAWARAPLAFLALRAINQLWYFALLGLFAAAAVIELRRRARRATPDRLVGAALWHRALSQRDRDGVLRPVALPLSGDAVRLRHRRVGGPLADGWLERRANAPVADSAHDFAPAARQEAAHDDASRHHHDYHHPGQPGRFRLRA
jgi:hypothetical protein